MSKSITKTELAAIGDALNKQANALEITTHLLREVNENAEDEVRPSKPERTNFKLIDVDVDGINTRDAPDFCDAFIAFARWEDTGEELTQEELEEIDSSVVYDYVMDWLY